jgi:hypothetical protein
MEITDEAYDSIVRHLSVTLDDLAVPAEIIAQVESRLEALRTQIVGA